MRTGRSHAGVPDGDVSSHLDRFRDGLLAVVGLRGLYLDGSLTTGDVSPAKLREAARGELEATGR